MIESTIACFEATQASEASNVACRLTHKFRVEMQHSMQLPDNIGSTSSGQERIAESTVPVVQGTAPTVRAVIREAGMMAVTPQDDSGENILTSLILLMIS